MFTLDPYEKALVDFECAISKKIGRPPQLMQPFEAGNLLAELRCKLVDEEATELMVALRTEDLHQVAKESADLIYVTFGTAVAFGVPLSLVFERVHENNMAKITNGIWDGAKLLKAKNHPKTVLTDLLPGLG